MNIKILEMNKQTPANSLIHNKSTKIKSSTTENFAAELENLQGKQITEKLQNLLAEIDKQTQKIGNNIYLKDLIKYKKLVKDFLNLSTRESYQFSKENFLDSRGRHRILSIIKKVDKELEFLTQQFLKNEKDRIKILQKMDDIRGLLIDILM